MTGVEIEKLIELVLAAHPNDLNVEALAAEADQQSSRVSRVEDVLARADAHGNEVQSDDIREALK